MQLVQEHSRLWQADGEADWKTIGTEEELEVPENGYIAVYLSNQGAEPVYFDNLAVNVTPGVLLEEKHYYPYGLPIQGWGNVATGSLPNRQRYQGNEYREEAGLNWMDFHNRQYDPQLGRFLSLDPLADAGGQQVLSPYHAMGCNPAMMVDPFGLRSSVFDNGASHPNPPVDPLAYAKAMFPTMHRYVPGGDLFNAGNMARNSMMDDTYTTIVLGRFLAAWGESRAQSAANNTASSDAGSGKQASEGMSFSVSGKNYGISYSSGSPVVTEIMEAVSVVGKKADWADWGRRMQARYGNSLDYSFDGYGQSRGFWDDVNDGFSIIWNSPIARRYIPDKISFAIGGDIALGGGVGAQPINFTILTRGKDPGVYLTPTFNTYAGIGAFFSGGVELTISNYTGDPRKITASMLIGETNGGYATGGLLGDFSGGVTYSPATNVHGFFNLSVGIGIGGGAFGGYNYQYTPGYKKF